MTWIVSIVSAILYRLGGIGKPFNTKIRDMGIPTVCLIWMIFKYPSVAWYWHLLSWGAMFGALTTYWDSLLGYDNFYLHGFMIGFAYLFYAIGSRLWLWFILRAVILGVGMGLWCKFYKKDWVEEGGRGAMIGLSLPLLTL